jgi:hypothetical protein
VIELRKTLTGALNSISDGEGNKAGRDISRVTDNEAATAATTNAIKELLATQFKLKR